jgi:hypothetical protein
MQSRAGCPGWAASDALDESCQTYGKVYAKWPVAQSGEARWGLLSPYRVCQRFRAEGVRSVFVRGLLSLASQTADVVTAAGAIEQPPREVM